MLEIENAKAINLDTLFRKFTVAKEKRIAFFGQRLEKVLAELDKRDLSTIPTEKLFKIVIDLSDRLKAEEMPLQLAERTEGGLHIDFDALNIKRWEI